MFDALEKIFYMVLLLAFLFLVPTKNELFLNEDKIYNYIDTTAAEFVDEVRSSGCITRETLDKFYTDISNAKRLLKISFVHRKVQYFPLQPYDYGYVAPSGNDPGVTYKALALSISDKQIKNVIYKDKKNYYLSKDDYFRVSIDDYSDTDYMVLKQMTSSFRPTNLIHIKYGGKIGNEGN